MSTLPNKSLQDPAYNSTAWNVPLNSNFTNIDVAFGQVQAFNLAGVSGIVNVSGSVYAGPYPANTASYIPSIWSILGGGVPAGNVNLQLPTGVGGRFLVYCPSSFTHSIEVSSAGAGLTINITQGGTTDFFCDGVNVLATNNSSVLPGTLIAYAGLTAPSGYLLCYGQSLSTTTYANLFGVIGYTYGGSGGSFNVPDLRSNCIIAPDNMGGTPAGRIASTYVGQEFGVGYVALDISTMPYHNHGDSGHSHGINDPGHNHGGVLVPGGGFGLSAPPYVPGQSGNTSTAGTGISVQTNYANITYTGGGAPHINIQPTIVVNWAIKY